MRTLTLLFTAFAAFLLPSGPGLSAHQPDPPADPTLEDAIRLRGIVQAVHLYSHMHDGKLPEGLADLTPFLSGKGDQSGLRRFLFSTRAPRTEIPPDPGAEWFDAHASFKYIGAGGLDMEAVPDWGSIALGHLDYSLGHPVPATPETPEDSLVTVGFVDGHVELLPEAQARWIIEDSRATFAALKEGKPLPDHRQILLDGRLIARAIADYAAAHDGLAPPTLGAALEFVPDAPGRPRTLREKAEIFLAPAARRGTAIPENPTADWVNTNTSYTYLAGNGVLLRAIEDPMRTIILHSKSERTFERTSPREPLRKGMLFVTVSLNVSAAESEFVTAMSRESGEVIRAVAEGLPLPPYQDSVRDLRILSGALRLYAEAHEGALPPTIGATLAFLEPAGLGKADEAAKAKVYLIRGDERTETLPETVSPEWVDRATSYIYLGPGTVNARARDNNSQWRFGPLLHGPVSKPFAVLTPEGMVEAVPYSTFETMPVYFMPAASAEPAFREARARLSEPAKK